MGPRANAAFFPTVARTTVDYLYPGHRTGEQAASGPRMRPTHSFHAPLGKAPGPTSRHLQGPSLSSSLHTVEKGSRFFIRALVHLLRFGPIPRLGTATWAPGTSVATWAPSTRQSQKTSCLPSC